MSPHFRVRIERVTSTAALSQHLQEEVLSQQDRGAIELETLTSQGQTGNITTIAGRWMDGNVDSRKTTLLDSL